MGYKYILFDLDGTLTEPKEGIVNSINYALEFFGVKVDDVDSLSKYIGPPLIDTFRDGFGFEEEKAYQAIDKYREFFSEKGIFQNKVYDGIVDLLKNLSDSGKKLFLATSKPSIYANKILKHFDLSRYITFVSGSELDGTRNNKNEVIEYALKEVQVMQNGTLNKDEVIMVGDRKYDIYGAIDMQIKSVGVLYGYGTYDELKKAGADYIIDTVSNLYEFLK